MRNVTVFSRAPSGTACLPSFYEWMLSWIRSYPCFYSSQIWVSSNYEESPGKPVIRIMDPNSWPPACQGPQKRPPEQTGSGRLIRAPSSCVVLTALKKKKKVQILLNWQTTPVHDLTDLLCCEVGNNLLITDKILRCTEQWDLLKSWSPEQSACCCRMRTQVCDSGVWTPILPLTCEVSQPPNLASCPQNVAHPLESLRQEAVTCVNTWNTLIMTPGAKVLWTICCSYTREPHSPNKSHVSTQRPDRRSGGNTKVSVLRLEDTGWINWANGNVIHSLCLSHSIWKASWSSFRPLLAEHLS